MNRMPLFAVAVAALSVAAPGRAQQKSIRLSIATGGTGGVYYPLGGGLANVLSKSLPSVEATAEVTSASVDNIKLVGAGKVDIAFTLGDMALDGYRGAGKFKEKVPVSAIAVLYANKSQWVTVEGSGIQAMRDLKGKRIATGAPGSGTEVIALRILEAYGIDPEKDVKREKLSVAESGNALKDRKIDAFFWSGGVPTAAVTDLAATPGIKIRLLDHADAIPAMVKKHGSLYVKGSIPAGSYPGQQREAQVADVWNLLVVNEKMDEKLVHDVVQTLFERKADLVAVHSEAANLNLSTQLDGGSAIPFHPGALRYFSEKGLKPR
ncbi:MAG TPA: TAXI family TRAP transporter solute-binding subunit [Anaeromyxobacteraceae bacterium]|nr:TAXI family TRAP transporter solute-binding subunit [Anaeromyxobacteraceae bacterium]